MQSWSSGGWQRASLWSSPAPLSGSTAAWQASIFTTGAPRARPPCCPWLRAFSESAQSTGSVCGCVEDWTPCRSMWPYPTYGPVTRDCTCGSWATESRTALSRSSSAPRRLSCWLKGQVCHTHSWAFRTAAFKPKFLCFDFYVYWCVLLQGGHASALVVTLHCSWSSLQQQGFFCSHSSGWP